MRECWINVYTGNVFGYPVDDRAFTIQCAKGMAIYRIHVTLK